MKLNSRRPKNMEDNIVLLYGDCNAEQIVRIGLSGHIRRCIQPQGVQIPLKTPCRRTSAPPMVGGLRGFGGTRRAHFSFNHVFMWFFGAFGGPKAPEAPGAPWSPLNPSGGPWKPLETPGGSWSPLSASTCME